MAKKSSRPKRGGRRVYSDELKGEAVQMLLDGHPATSVASNLGLASVSLLYRGKAKLLRQSGTAAATLENRVRQLEEDLRRVERERDEPCGRRRVGRLMDRFSRRIVGWDLPDHMRESPVSATDTTTPGGDIPPWAA